MGTREREKSATIKEIGRVPITGKIIVFVIVFSFSFSNLGIEYNLGLNFLAGLV